MSLRLIVLGAAAGGGLPQWNCNGANSAGFWRGRAPFAASTQSSLAVSADGEQWALLNASPDLRAQILATPALHPRDADAYGLRDTPIASVTLTNGDIDHVAGLLTLRERQAFTIFATREVGRFLSDNPIFNAVDPQLAPRRLVDLETPFDIAPGLQATLFAAPGKVPLYLEGEEVRTDVEGEQTVGVALAPAGAQPRVFYIPGCARVTDALKARLRGADILLFDGTLWSDDEMITQGVGVKTGRRMGHMPISGPDGSIAALDGLAIGRKIFVHLNNTNPLWLPDGPERAEAAAAGWEAAFDGMEISA